jgi:uncharacterized membrane protein YfcA
MVSSFVGTRVAFVAAVCVETANAAQIFFFEYPNPFVWWQIALFALAAFIGSVAIGAVGVGGAMIVPFMLMLPGMDGPIAIGTLFVAFIPAVLARLVWWARAKKVTWRDAAPLGAGALPGSIGGAILVQYSPRPVLSLLVGAVCLFSGIHTMYKMYNAYREAARAKKTRAAEKAVPEPTNRAPSEATLGESGESSPARSHHTRSSSLSSAAISSEAFEYVFRDAASTGALDADAMPAVDADAISLDEISVHGVGASGASSAGSTTPVTVPSPRTRDCPDITHILVSSLQQQERLATVDTTAPGHELLSVLQFELALGCADAMLVASGGADVETRTKTAGVNPATPTTSDTAQSMLDEPVDHTKAESSKCSDVHRVSNASEAGSEAAADALSVKAILAKRKAVAQERILRFFLLGFLTSCFSVISGTGGPLLLFPFLMIVMPKLSLHELLGLSAPFTSVVCIGATLGSISHGKMDGGLAIILAVVSTLGMVVGAHYAMKLPAFQLRLAVALLLIVTAVITIREAIGNMQKNGVSIQSG